MRYNGSSTKPQSSARTLAVVGVSLALGAGASTVGLIDSVHNERGKLILWLGELSVTLIFGSSLCLFLALAAVIKRRNRAPGRAHRQVTVSVDYVARYPRSDRIQALLLAGFFAALTVFFGLRSATAGMIIAASIFAVAVWYAVHVMSLSVRFTDDGFVARLAWFRELREPYDRVVKILTKPGTITVHFSDGRSLKLHPGLGDAETVIAQLRTRCPAALRVDD